MKLIDLKIFLDTGTFEGLRYIDESKSRFVSFDMCLNFLETRHSISILELGTCRSFVDGKFEGCNSNDTIYWKPQSRSFWDWGAGCFSLVFGLLAKYDSLITVDLMDSHIRRCKIMTDSLGISCKHVVSDSLSFLASIDKQFDLIYVDTGDMWPIQPTCELQLKEVQKITERGLLKDGGLLLIDDVLNGTPRELGDSINKFGKSEKSIPYLMNNGFDLMFEGYQYVFRKHQ